MYIDFYKKFQDNILITPNDIRVSFPKFNIVNLSKRQKKWYIKKLRKGFYIFSDTKIDTNKLFYIANKLNAPSYIGMESAMSYYSIIPEWVFTIHSISTKRINKLNTPIGNFSYRTIKKKLFWWYKIVNIKNRSFYISDLEKTLLDYFYFNSYLDSLEDIKWLRLNNEILKRKLKIKKLEKYLEIFDNRNLEKRIYTLIDYIYAWSKRNK